MLTVKNRIKKYVLPGYQSGILPPNFVWVMGVGNQWLSDCQPEGTERTEREVVKTGKALAKERSEEIKQATPTTAMQWCNYEK